MVGLVPESFSCNLRSFGLVWGSQEAKNNNNKVEGLILLPGDFKI